MWGICVDCFLREFGKAVELLKQVDAPSACSLLLKHGSALLRHSASDVLLLLSQFIKDYHTRWAQGTRWNVFRLP